MIKRIFTGAVATALALSLVACGTDAETVEEGTPGTSHRDYDSNTEREFKQPDEFYDYGDYDFVKVFRLADGTRCVMAKVHHSYGGAGITCDW